MARDGSETMEGKMKGGRGGEEGFRSERMSAKGLEYFCLFATVKVCN